MAEKFQIFMNRISGRNTTPNDGYVDSNRLAPEVSMDAFNMPLTSNGFPMDSMGDKSMDMSKEME